uniref:DnaJ domain containing protein, putative n=1 Tax=Theileria annulata TaxID=5874 RepID=A0A3B0MXD2_THEAN
MGKNKTPKLYLLLGIDQTATTRDVVKAYRLAALKSHPDKLQGLSKKEQEDAKNHFVQLKHAYEILKDDHKRKNYDEFGWEGEEEAAFDAAYEFYRTPVTQEDIVDFSKNYKGSKSESEDLLDFYNKYDGDLTNLLFSIPLSDTEDLDRFLDFFNKNIKSKKLKSTPNFVRTSKPKHLTSMKNKYKKTCKKAEKTENDMDFEELSAQILVILYKFMFSRLTARRGVTISQA